MGCRSLSYYQTSINGDELNTQELLILSGLDYEHTDHLGNVRVTFKNIGSTEEPEIATTSWTDYYPFGEAMPGRSLSGAEEPMYGYQGQERVGNGSKWYNFNLRMYNPSIGRFNTIDPYSQFNSPYLAMANNPISFVDPDGGYVVLNEFEKKRRLLYRERLKDWWRENGKEFRNKGGDRNGSNLFYHSMNLEYFGSSDFEPWDLTGSYGAGGHNENQMFGGYQQAAINNIITMDPYTGRGASRAQMRNAIGAMAVSTWSKGLAVEALKKHMVKNMRTFSMGSRSMTYVESIDEVTALQYQEAINGRTSINTYVEDARLNENVFAKVEPYVNSGGGYEPPVKALEGSASFRVTTGKGGIKLNILGIPVEVNYSAGATTHQVGAAGKLYESGHQDLKAEYIKTSNEKGWDVNIGGYNFSSTTGHESVSTISTMNGWFHTEGDKESDGWGFLNYSNDGTNHKIKAELGVEINLFFIGVGADAGFNLTDPVK